jgi:hypothetical protein
MQSSEKGAFVWCLHGSGLFEGKKTTCQDIDLEKERPLGEH